MSFLSQGELPLFIAAYGYGAVAGIVGLESIGIPLPGESTVIAAAVIAGSGHGLDIRLVIAAAATGAILGDNVGFWIGREFGYRLTLRFGRYVGLTERRMRVGQYLFLRYGAEVVFFGRFVAILRTFAAVLAGLNCMGWARFLVFNIAGGIAWAVIYGLGGYYLGKEVDLIAKPLGLAIGAAAVVSIAVFLIWLHRHEAALERRAEAALPRPLRPPRRKH